MKNWKTKLLLLGTRVSAFAVVIATLLAPTCRNAWFQPKEPDNLKQLLRK